MSTSRLSASTTANAVKTDTADIVAPDLYARLAKLWRRWLKPFLQRISVRVTRRGFWAVASWTLWVVGYSVLNLLSMTSVVQTSIGKMLTSLLPVLSIITIIITVFMALMIVVDFILLLTATGKGRASIIASLQIRRELAHNLSVQAWSTVRLMLSYHQTQHSVTHGSMPFTITLLDNYPTLASTEQLPITFLSSQILSSQILSNQTKSATGVTQNLIDNDDNIATQHLCVSYRLFANQRGYTTFDGIALLIRSRIGWLQKYVEIPESAILGTHQARVLANFSAIVAGQLVGVSRHSAMAGQLKQRRRGQGQDFHQIRNYSQGDSVRHLDWKASARYQRLMTREYQDERDQQILCLLDCGQHMRHLRLFDPTQSHAQADNSHTGSHLDQALNAMLLLAQIANAQGDATGFVSFASHHDKVVLPRKGVGVISYLLNQSFDLQPSDLTPDYIAVARQVRQVQKKRALIILISNTRQQESSELIEAIQLLSAKHVVIFANLYEQDLQTYIDAPPSSHSNALTYHSVQEYLAMREQLHASLSQQTHVYTIHCTPQQLPHQLIEQYFIVKQRHRL